MGVCLGRNREAVVAREDIDWHAFTYENAFIPAARAMRRLLKTNSAECQRKLI